MNPVQPHIQTIRHLPTKFGRYAIKTLDIETQAPINDAWHRDFHRDHEGKRLVTIVAMLGMIAYLVWSMG